MSSAPQPRFHHRYIAATRRRRRCGGGSGVRKNAAPRSRTRRPRRASDNCTTHTHTHASTHTPTHKPTHTPTTTPYSDVTHKDSSVASSRSLPPRLPMRRAPEDVWRVPRAMAPAAARRVWAPRAKHMRYCVCASSFCPWGTSARSNETDENMNCSSLLAH